MVWTNSVQTIFLDLNFGKMFIMKNLTAWFSVKTSVDLRLNCKQSVAHVYFKKLTMSTSYLCDKLWCGITEDF